MSFFSRLFCFIAFSGIFQRGEFKNTTHKAAQKFRVEKLLQKDLQKSSKTILSRFCLSRFWAFLGEGNSKTPPKKYRTLLIFVASDLPAYRVLFLAAPCVGRGRSRRSSKLQGSSIYPCFGPPSLKLHSIYLVLLRGINSKRTTKKDQKRTISG
jgi:hypothetical protein